MSLERGFRQRVVKALKSLDALSIENGVGAGTPDVNFADGWIELKSIDDWPKRPATPLRVDHFTAAQRAWLRVRCLRGGRAFLLLKVGPEVLLFRGDVAAEVLGTTTREELYGRAERRWDCFDGAGLLQYLRETTCSKNT